MGLQQIIKIFAEPPTSDPTATLECYIDMAKTTKGRHMTSALTVGAQAPDFTLSCAGGGEISLADFRGRKLVLYFYPRAGTPGCTREAIDFSTLAPTFAKANTAILGVSADPLRQQDAFKVKHSLTITLASDQTARALKAYGVWGKKTMYGKTFMGVKRTTFLIGTDGRIARVWKNVKVDGHAKEVLAAAQAL